MQCSGPPTAEMSKVDCGRCCAIPFAQAFGGGASSRATWCSSSSNVRLRVTNEHDMSVADLIGEYSAHSYDGDNESNRLEGGFDSNKS